jgi:hypothetical protein
MLRQIARQKLVTIIDSAQLIEAAKLLRDAGPDRSDLCGHRARSGSWLKLNAEYAPAWPNITVKREQPADANAFDGVANKLKQYFSPNPGQRD